MFWLNKAISPLDLLTCIVTILKVLDFPAPFAPSNPTISRLAFTSNEIPWTALTFPEYVLVRFLAYRYFDLSL